MCLHMSRSRIAGLLRVEHAPPRRPGFRLRIAMSTKYKGHATEMRYPQVVLYSVLYGCILLLGIIGSLYSGFRALFIAS